MKNYIFFFLLFFTATIANSQVASISGSISKPNGDVIPNATLTLKADNFEQTTMTDNSGVYSFAEVPRGITYTLEIDRTDDLLNGLSTFDMVQMMQTILALPVFEVPVQNLAADIDLSGSVSVRDVWLLRQVILGFTTTLDTPIWRFVPTDYRYPDPIQPISVTLNESIDNLNFIGAKAGDVNGSARF